MLSGLSLLFGILRWLRRIGELGADWLSRVQSLFGSLRKIFQPRISHDPRSKCYIHPSLDASSKAVADPTVHHVDPPKDQVLTQFQDHDSLAVPMDPKPQSSTAYQVQDPNSVVRNAARTGNAPDPTNPGPSELAVDMSPPEPQPAAGLSVVTFQSTHRMPEPMLANEIQRYDRGKVVKPTEKLIKIHAGEKVFACKTRCPEPWLPLTHPEGALYFYHPHRRIFTDADIRTPEIRKRIDSYADTLKQWVEYHYPNIVTADAELALELFGDQTKQGGCKYYYVDHQKRVLFWAHEFAPEIDLMENVKSVSDLSHVRYMIEAEYWYAPHLSATPIDWTHRRMHCELFPNRRYLPEAIVDELKETILHANTEIITSDLSLSPYDKEELSGIYSLLDSIQSIYHSLKFLIVLLIELFSWQEGVPPTLSLGNRLMRQFTKVKFVNWCGQPTARLDADQSIYERATSQRRTSLLLQVLNRLLFGSPEAHLKSIRRMWVDEIVVQPRWKNFIVVLNDEWNRFTIFATVILAVDVSFLAVPGVLSASPSLATLSVYLSTLCAVGSLLVSVTLSGQINNQSRDSAEGVANLMTRMTNTMLKRDSLAIVHSLPFALLIWGMIFFSLALSYLIFQSKDLVTFLTIGPGWAVVGVLTLWPVFMDLRTRKRTKHESADVEESLATSSSSSSIASGEGSV
ncbi:hypothetical protein BDN67DRAFT_1012905 [Paxillus ammoniavirescens]|nr:hypothetical protein BDN67DRAFT_1012905 [Paxillus ammoniavirescens]